MTLDILICSLNKGVVRIQDVLLPPQPNVHYIVSYQYTDERYLDLIPQALGARPDVSVYTYKGQGLSANRNLALDKATADIIMYADDDAHILPETPSLVMRRFEESPQYDVLFFKASTYTDKPLKTIQTRTLTYWRCQHYTLFLHSRWHANVRVCKASYVLTSDLDLAQNSSHVARKKYGLKMRYALASNCITFLTKS